MAPHHMTREQKQMARRLRSKGLKLREIARELSCSMPLVKISVYAQGDEVGIPDRWTPAPGRLGADEREEILLGLGRGESMSAIARSLGRAPSTVTREVAANGGASRYGAWRAHCRAEASSRRPKPAKLAHPPLARQVTTWLERLWSPQEIAERLRLDFGDDPMMQVSHETIYQSLFVQGRGGLRRELARCLRSGRTARRHGPVEKRPKNSNMVMISERPAEAEDRPGLTVDRHAIPWRCRHVIPSSGVQFMSTRWCLLPARRSRRSPACPRSRATSPARRRGIWRGREARRN